jgi:ribosomal protein L28
MSTHIQYNIKSVSTNATSNLINSVDNKWTKMIDTIILSSKYKSKRSNKRIGSPNLQNKWTEQDDQVIKRKKNQILTYKK